MFSHAGDAISHGFAANQFNAAGISGSWEGQNFVSASQTFLSTGQRNGDSAITGSLIVQDTVFAQEFHSETVSQSIIYTSGSTKFGGDFADNCC